MEAINCSLVSIISPGEYVVLDEEDEHWSNIKHVEELLTKESVHWEELNIKLFADMSVAVKLEKSDIMLKRGQLKRKLDDNLFEVYLVDYGKIVNIEKCNIFVTINDRLNSIEPLKFTVTLHGLVPTKMFAADDCIKQKISKTWSVESKEFVEKLFQMDRKIQLNCILIYSNMVYGDIIIKQNEIPISLRKLLISQEFCVYSQKFFLRELFNINHSSTESGTGTTTEQKSNVVGTIKPYLTTTNKFNALNDNFERTSETSCSDSLAKGELPKNTMALDRYETSQSSKSESKSLANGDGNPEIRRQRTEQTKETIKATSHSEVDSTNNELNEMLLIDDPMLRKSISTFGENAKTIDAISKDMGRCEEEQNTLQQSSEYADPFVFCSNSSIEPVKNFNHLALDVSTKQDLGNYVRVDHLNPIQRWILPAILSKNDVVIIGGSKTGKTLSYVIPLMDFVKKETSKKLPEGNGPLVVIVCSTSSAAECVHFMCKSLSATFVDKSGENLKIVLAYGGKCEKEAWVRLTNGCHILISTPHCLVRLIEMPIITNFEQLSWVVFDEVDVISQRPFGQSIRLILERIQSSSKSRHCQKIFCGEKWTPNVESLVKLYLKNYILIFGSYFEAAICARVKPKIYYVERERKCRILLDEIQNVIGKYSVLIICENSLDATAVNEFLNNRGVNSVVAHEHTTAEECDVVRSAWKIHRIVVATDDIMHELSIRNADVLINYSVTRKSKSNFFFRYSTILDNSLTYDTELKELRRSTKSNLIFLDDNSHHQLPQILEFLNRLGGEIPPRIIEKCHEIQNTIEASKSSPICQNLLLLGECRHWKYCSERHTFVKALDSPRQHPSRGWISFVVVKVHNATSFSIKIVEHLDVNGKKLEISNCSNLHEKIQNYYQLEQNRRPCVEPKIGQICGVECYSGHRKVFERAEVVQHITTDKHCRPTVVKVRLIDNGDSMQLKVMELYELPGDLAVHPPAVIEAKLIGIQPMDYDIAWNRHANLFAKTLMMQPLEKEQFWFGKIVIALKNLLFLDRVVLRRYLSNVKTHVIDLVLQDKLSEGRFSVENDNHLATLCTLCAEGDIEVPKEEVTKTEVSWDEPQWAFLEKDRVPVNLSAVENIDKIYLQNQKFETLLKTLENDCCRAVSESEKRRKMKESKNFKLSVGMFCLARHNDKWKRGTIKSETATAFNIYFVDYGNFSDVEKENVTSISKSLLMRLPCQAIECSLVGIRERKDRIDDILEEIRAFSTTTITDNNTLYAYVHRNDLKSENTKGRKYSVNLLNSDGKSLNRYLLDSDLVQVVEDEQECVEDIPLIISKPKDDQRDYETRDVEVLEEKMNFENNSENTSPEFSTQMDLNKSFSLMSDSLFENESELLFLREFASKVFPRHNNDESKTADNKVDTGNSCKLRDNQMTECRIPERKIDQNRSEVRSRINFKRLLSMHLPLLQAELKNNDGILTPQVLWKQDQLLIQIKVLLGDVVKYKCQCTVTNMLFRCILGEKAYAVDLKLYGAIDPKSTTIVTKAFHVTIHLKKLCAWLWPRLSRDGGKHHWIRLDVENLNDEENDHSNIIEAAKRNIEAGILKEGIRMPNIRAYSESEDSNEDEDALLSDNDE